MDIISLVCFVVVAVNLNQTINILGKLITT